MKIVLWGTYDTSKPRVRILSEGIQRGDHDLVECHAEVWRGIADKSQLKGWLRKLFLLLTWLCAYPKLWWRYWRLPPHDLVLISYPGLLDVLSIAGLARLRGVPVAWDMFISLYDTMVEDRRLLGPGTLSARMLWWFERLAVRAVDLVFMDTEAHARRVEGLFGLPAQACGAVFVGTETDHFTINEAEKTTAPVTGPLRVLFYGQFIPLHGIGHIIEAAHILRDEAVEWVLIGIGQEADRIRELLARNPLPKVRWLEWVEYDHLVDWIDAADLCLGIFGGSVKAASVIPNKVFQVVAAGRPLITRDSPAIRELLHHDPPCVSLVPAESGAALASAIRAFMAMTRGQRVRGCHRELRHRIDAAAVGEQFHRCIEGRLGTKL